MYPMAVMAFVCLFPLISVLWVRWGRAPEQMPSLRSCVLCILVSNISWVLALLLVELRDYRFDHPARVLVSGCLYYTVMSLIITPCVYGLMSLWGSHGRDAESLGLQIFFPMIQYAQTS